LTALCPFPAGVGPRVLPCDGFGASAVDLADGPVLVVLNQAELQQFIDVLYPFQDSFFRGTALGHVLVIIARVNFEIKRDVPRGYYIAS